MTAYENKFNLTLEQNIFLAKKTIIQNIYNSAKLEGLNVTFPDTQTILNGSLVPNIRLDELEVILNLRDAWRFLLNNINKPLELEYICKINSYISRNESLDWGVLRYGNVGIGGTDYRPEIPEENKVRRILQEIKKIENPTDRALEYFAWAVKSQLFWDGNKRTSSLIVNKILIENGAGIFTVPENKIYDFNIELNNYYNKDDKEKFKQFLYNNCIEGIEIPAKEEFNRENIEAEDEEELEL
ncbi:Fic family protein [Tissierella praeacuta]|uniref:Fic family protein n=1 Tax=Tissierella praeacuta TaxID=43131 RepID=UPI003DA5E9B4